MKSFIKKNIFNSLVLLSGTLLIFTGCEKSFLKADPLSFYEPEQTYSTESGLKSVLAIACLLYTSSITDNKEEEAVSDVSSISRWIPVAGL